jgi:hypothetical protein
VALTKALGAPLEPANEEIPLPKGLGAPKELPPPNPVFAPKPPPEPKPVAGLLAKAEPLPKVDEPPPKPELVPPAKPPLLLVAEAEAPNGDFSEDAKADKPEEAKAEVDVVVVVLEDGFSGDFGDLKLPKGEAADVFANPDDRGMVDVESCGSAEVVLVVDLPGCESVVDVGAFPASSAVDGAAVVTSSISSCDGAETKTPGPPGDFSAAVSVSSCIGLAMSSFFSRVCTS